MNTEEYTKNVVARASNEYHDNINLLIIAQTLAEFSGVAGRLDIIKKALFYGKISDEVAAEVAMVDAMRPRPDVGDVPNYFGCLSDSDEPIVLSDKQIALFHAILGLATEAGELVEGFIKSLDNVQAGRIPVEDAFDNINMNEEFGDALWYVALGIDAIGSNLNACMTTNDRKLEARYGPAFSAERANERDLDNERKVLEDK